MIGRKSLFATLIALVVLIAGFASLVYAQSGQTNFRGNVTVTGGASVLGALSKGSGTFVIDHPFRPQTHLLYHSFVESPDVKNIYDGVVELDDKGRATIILPDYFLALNEDFRYLATPIGEPMPDLFIDRGVRKRFLGLFGEPVFTIAGGEPGGKVSWQVTGIRHDPFIRENPLIPQVKKGDDQPFDVGECVLESLCQ